MNSTQHWTAISVHSNFEKKVSKLLDKKCIVHYYPQHFVSVGSSHQKGFSPLFPSMIFVQVSDNISLSSLTQLPHVNSMVYWQQNPANFPAAEIDLLRNFLETYKTVQLKKIPLGVENDKFLQPAAGTHHFSEDNIHTINLPSIGYSLSAKTEAVTNVKLLRKKAIGQRTTYSNLALMFGIKSNSVG